MIEAVTFDFWETLVSERPGQMRRAQTERFAATLAEAGEVVADEALTEAFAANWANFERHWHDNLGPYSAADSVAYVCERLSIVPDGSLAERLIDGFRVVGETVPLDVAPGIGECLSVLRSAGIRVGIVCDVGLTSSPTLRRRLQGFGLLDAFEAWAFSDETGWFKPARRGVRSRPDGPRRRRPRPGRSRRRYASHRHRRSEGARHDRGPIHGPSRRLVLR